MLKNLRIRYPRLFPAATFALALGTVGGIAAYEKRASAESCCFPGSPCCYPGSPCCAGHDHAANAAK